MAAPFIPPAITPPDCQLPFFAALRAMLDNPMEAWPRAIYEEPVYVPPRADFRRIYLCEPHALKRVFLDEVEEFPKSPLAQKLLTPMLGQGLVTASHAASRWQRRAAAPAFQHQGIKQSAPAIAACVETALARWRKHGDSAVDICAEMMRITFDIILDTMLGGRDNVDAVEMGRQFNAYLSYLGKPSLADVLGAPAFIRKAFAADGGACVDFMKDAVDRLINERRNTPPRGDLIDLLMRGADQSGRTMNDIELRDNILTFLAAGHETTALSLTWALYLISQQRECEARMLEEIAKVAGDAPIDAEMAAKLSYTRWVIEEAMRLYPPVPVLARTARKDCNILGKKVHRGDAVIAPIYALHRHRLYWQRPDEFWPERFNEPRFHARQRYIYMPFGAGPRICLGAQFAMIEATIVLATIIRAYAMRLREGYKVRPLLRITMRPEGGLPMQMVRRSSVETMNTMESAA